MERDLKRAFRDLGKRAVAAFRQSQGKSLDVGALAWAEGFLKQIDPQDAARVDAMTRSMHITDWDEKILKPGYERSYLRTMELTADTIRTTTGLAVNLPDSVGRRIVSDGGRRIGLVDIQGQSRTALFHSLAEGRALGEGPDALARRIRDRIGRGRYKTVEKRAYVIARTETKYAQNLSSIELYQSMETVTGMLAFDAQVGATDAECEQRNGVVYSAADARSELGFEHPLGTLSFAPEIGRPRRPQPTTSPPERIDPLPRLPRGGRSIADEGFENLPHMPEDEFATFPGRIEPWENRALADYYPEYEDFNAIMRGARAATEYEKGVISRVDDLAFRNTALEGRVVVRGEVYPRNVKLPRYSEGDSVSFDAFTSTSLEADVAFGPQFGRSGGARAIGWEIHGSDRLRTIATHTGPREILIMPGQKLRIVEVRQNVLLPSADGEKKFGQWVVAVVE